LFDNHTAKATWRPSSHDTIVGYYQQGRKQKPRRGISALTSPESVVNQDTMSRMYKGEWQRVLSARAFFDLTLARFTLDGPFTSNTDPVAHPPTVALDTGHVTGAPFGIGSSNRSKPQLKAQLTYYVPDRTGSHDFKFGFENMYDWYRVGSNGVTGPIQYRTQDGTPMRLRFLDVGSPDGYGTTWGPSPNIDRH
jgi:hypothetical protein